MKTQLLFILLFLFAINCIGQNQSGQKGYRMKSSATDTASYIPPSSAKDNSQTNQKMYRMRTSVNDTITFIGPAPQQSFSAKDTSTAVPVNIKNSAVNNKEEKPASPLK